MERSRIVALLRKYQSGELSAEEQTVLQQWADSHSANRELMERTADGTWLSQALRDYDEVLTTDDHATAQLLARQIMDRATPKPNNQRTLRQWLPYVAAAVVALAVGTWVYTENSLRPSAVNEAFADILPGGNRATLILADGHMVDLSDMQEGIIFEENNVRYNDGSHIALPPSETLVLTTPKGGTYQVTLPDGSKVWLNAASTLKYPSRFADDARQVEIVGEGYFEVAKDVRKPFRAVSTGQQVEVLGTEFNISTYPDEGVTRTTLIEGKVDVVLDSQSASVKSITLSPSEQAMVKNGILTKEVVDVNSEIAWRNGFFAFRRERLEDVMRKVARWYDVEVEFKGNAINRTFSGTVSRYANISEVLETLSLTDRVQFEIRNKTILVQSK